MSLDAKNKDMTKTKFFYEVIIDSKKYSEFYNVDDAINELYDLLNEVIENHIENTNSKFPNFAWVSVFQEKSKTIPCTPEYLKWLLRFKDKVNVYVESVYSGLFLVSSITKVLNIESECDKTNETDEESNDSFAYLDSEDIEPISLDDFNSIKQIPITITEKQELKFIPPHDDPNKKWKTNKPGIKDIIQSAEDRIFSLKLNNVLSESKMTTLDIDQLCDFVPGTCDRMLDEFSPLRPTKTMVSKIAKVTNTTEKDLLINLIDCL